MQQQKISVIIRNNNNAQGLELTLESVISQKYAHIECFVVDSGSSTGILNIIEAYKNAITYWISEEQVLNKLVSDALLKISEGYIYIINSGYVLCDDTVLEHLLINSQGEEILAANFIKIFPNGRHSSFEIPNEIFLDQYLTGWIDPLVSCLIKRCVFDSFDFYDKNLKYTTEWTFFLRFLLLPTVRYKHVNINLVTLPVGRHGGIGKLSNIQLTAKERQWVTENYVPASVKNILLEKKNLAKSYDEFNYYRFPKYSMLLLKSIQKKKKIVENRLKYFYQNLRTNVELDTYRKNNINYCFNIPIIINNRNHLTYLKQLIASLEKRGYRNIYIIDNDSDYGPLLEFYKVSPYKVFFLGKNVGFCALWDTEVFDYFKDSYYVYTDSDMELVDECPADFLVVLQYLLNKYSLGKIGLSLVTEDLPEHFANRDHVKEWESKFQEVKVESLAYQAMVDTTFALYKPNHFGDAGMLRALRTSHPYSIRHLPWYENTSLLSDEQKYYYENAKTSSHWSSKIRVKN